MPVETAYTHMHSKSKHIIVGNLTSKLRDSHLELKVGN